MTIKRSILHFSRAVFLLAMLAACTRLEDSLSGQANEGETVHVPISLAVAPTEEGTPGTKVDYEPDYWGAITDEGEKAAAIAASIKTITVLQFEKDKTGDDYTRVGNQVCYDWPLAAGENIALVTSSRENIIFVIANATDPGSETLRLAGNISLSSFLAKQNGNLLSTLDALDGTGIWYTQNGGADKYLRMSTAMKVDNVTMNTAIGTAGNPLYLKRNCAKVIIHVKNTSQGSDKVSIDAVQLREINKQYHFVTNIPAGVPVSFQDMYSALNAWRFDKEEQPFPAAYNTSGDTQTYTFYIPANLRGTISNASQGKKNAYAPKGASRFCVYATYGSPAKNITYTYFLGANLKDDFNLEPNKKYEYTININGKGNPETDSRIEDMNEVVFTKDANSYMLKPPTRSGASTTYSIPVRRAAIFWNQEGTNMGVYSAADRDAYRLLESAEWEAFLLWNEVKDKYGNFVADSELLLGSHDDGNGSYVVSGQGFNPTSGAKPFIKIKVEEGMTGNAVVALRKTTQPTLRDILWSWHLWVTEYDPYIEMTPVTGKYIYNVPDGEIHRYADGVGKSIWTSGTYKDGFIMDRNLGATTALPPEYDVQPAVGFYYQMGRKDPFPYPRAAEVVGADMTGEPPEGESGQKYNVRYSIHHPQTFLGNYSHWTAYETTGAILGSSDKSWLDPKIDSHGADNCEAGKSIYDPCPYGWQVPETTEVWSDFTAETRQVNNLAVGAYYYPGGINPQAPNGRVFYPCTGIYYYGYNVGGVSGIGLTSFVRVARSGYQIYANVSGYPYFYNGSAITVRCIRVENRRPY